MLSLAAGILSWVSFVRVGASLCGANPDEVMLTQEESAMFMSFVPEGGCSIIVGGGAREINKFRFFFN